MKRPCKLSNLLAIGAATFSAAIGWADEISPTSFSTTLAVGESVTISKTVTVSAGVGSNTVDVYFLADQTGSMGGAINNIKAAASTILSTVAGLGDVAFGVGGYNGESGNNSFQMHTNLTTNTATAQAGINSWFASGGGDEPEANLYGLFHAATDTTWRAGSERILIWFGDAPGHDPSPGGTTPSDGKKTEAEATAALVAAGINVQAISVGAARLDITGQATRITTATGGTLYNSISTSNIVSVITNAITETVGNYSVVGLDLSEVPSGVSVVAAPSSINGTFDRSIERTFDFDVTFTGVSEGTHSFNIYGTVDGGRVATESDRIVVGGASSVPDSGASVLLLGSALAGLAIWRRRR